MALLILDIENSTPTRAAHFYVARGESIGRIILTVPSDMGAAFYASETVTLHGSVAAGNIVVVERSGTSLGAEPLAPGELDFWFQKQAFDMIPKAQLVQHEGRFVASKDGTIVDSAPELDTLAERFFAKYGDVPVYMARIGQEFELRVDTPFFD